MSEQLACKERIKAELASTMETFELIKKLIDDPNPDPDNFTPEEIKQLEGLDIDPENFEPWEYLNEYGLSLELDSDTRGAYLGQQFREAVNNWGLDEKEAANSTGEALVKWCLSWGGPADYFIIEYTRKGRYSWSITGIAYCFQDWFDGAVEYLTGDNYKTMETIFDYYIGDVTGFFVS